DNNDIDYNIYNFDNDNNSSTYYHNDYNYNQDDNNNMTTNQHILTYLQRNLGGTTEWCETTTATTWAEWLQAFKEFFCTFRWINKWHRELEELRQNSDEAIDTYYAAHRRLIRKINKIAEMPAADQMRYFVKGLRPELAPIIMMNDPADVATAVDLIRKYEAGEDVVKRKEPRRSQKELESESEEEKPRRKETKKKKLTEKGDLDDLVQKFEKLQINLAQKIDLLTKQVNQRKEELLNQLLEAYLGKRERDEDSTDEETKKPRTGDYFKIPEVNTFGIPFRKEEFKTENKTKPTKRSKKKLPSERKKSTKPEKKEVPRLLRTKEFDIAEQMQKQEAGITWSQLLQLPGMKRTLMKNLK
ncbi:26786_t:CDS:2, partial [Dentiscutata erythropus]